MKAKTSIAMVLGTSIALLAFCGSVGAQNLGALKSAAGGADLSSLASGSAGNAAGVVEFCV